MKTMLLKGIMMATAIGLLSGCVTVNRYDGSVKRECVKQSDRVQVRVESARSLIVKDGAKAYRVIMPSTCSAFEQDGEFALSDVGPTGSQMLLRQELDRRFPGGGSPLVVERVSSRVCANDFVHYQRRGDFHQDWCRIERIVEVDPVVFDETR